MAKKATEIERTTWTPPNAVQLHVALDDIEPVIWRRLVVPLTATLADLHHILQAAMGWKDAHLHAFEIGGLRYGDPRMLEQQFEGDARSFDESKVRLRDFHFRYGDGPAFTYLYDFGDDWRHTVRFEKLLAEEPVLKMAYCIDGARCCPPEDVGGPHGYFDFMRVLLAPDADEREEQRHLKRWSGGKFDPEKLELAKTDKAVRRVTIKR